jgi:hypothetical protein
VTPAERAQLVAQAKRKAIPVASCVAARVRPDHLRLREMGEDGLIALVLILAAAADPVALRAVVNEPDDGYPDAEARSLRAAHAECNRLRAAKQPVPTRVALLEAEYQRSVAKPAPKAGLLAEIRSDEAQKRADAAKGQQGEEAA